MAKTKVRKQKNVSVDFDPWGQIQLSKDGSGTSAWVRIQAPILHIGITNLEIWNFDDKVNVMLGLEKEELKKLATTLNEFAETLQ